MKKKIISLITIVFFILVAYLLYNRISIIDFNEVKEGFSRIQSNVIVGSGILVIINYFILANYDYMGLRFLGQTHMKYPKVLLSAFICYAFTLNIGALVGGLGFRYRIYSGWYVPRHQIPIVILISTMSNWSGYILLLGILFLTQSDTIQKVLPIPHWLSLMLGITALLLIVAYLVLCKRRFQGKIKKVELAFPNLSIALMQLFLSCLQWLSLSVIIYAFFVGLGAQIEYELVLFTLLIGSVAGVVTHIPAGLGVLETIFFNLETGVRDADILVALLCFRAMYYFIPLLIALPSYFALEIYQKKKFIQQTG